MLLEIVYNKLVNIFTNFIKERNRLFSVYSYKISMLKQNIMYELKQNIIDIKKIKRLIKAYHKDKNEFRTKIQELIFDTRIELNAI